ncbi:MAG: hypothetical protein GY866_17630 [Proteobacteria bacterium]|nr:hypothetical protein [Pseudomonadota bacterium]
MKRIVYLFILAILQGAGANLWADESGNNGESLPQILTSDLIYRQQVEQAARNVSFVVVGRSPIQEVRINGQEQTFTPSKLVVVDKDFHFSPGKNRIEVVAVDKAGRRKSETYLVFYMTKETAPPEEKREESLWSLQGGFGLELDDNPTYHLGSPIAIGDIEPEELEQVDDETESSPLDRQEADNLANHRLLLLLSLGPFSLFAGENGIVYQKEENASLDSQIFYGGGGLNVGIGENGRLLLTLLATDINIGGENYALHYTVSPALQWSNEDEGSASRHSLGLSATFKDFASLTHEDDIQGVIAWKYRSLDKKQQDLFLYVFTVGNTWEGTEESEYLFAGMDFDWKNAWPGGMRWDFGFGGSYREYKTGVPLSTNTPLGSYRVDVPLRLSTSLGWAFANSWQVALDCRYTFNYSNNAPYQRRVYGLRLQGEL